MLGRPSIEHTVITASIFRDDLADSAPRHWPRDQRVKDAARRCARDLAGDFKGPHRSRRHRARRGPRRIRAQPRDRAAPVAQVPPGELPRSYKISSRARRRAVRRPADVGIGETAKKSGSPPRRVAKLGVDIVTLGQYSASKQTPPSSATLHHTESSSSRHYARGLASRM